MADFGTDEDSLISQEDIDKLLNASSFDEAEESLGASDDNDDGGEFSQDDIDSLLDGISTGSEPAQEISGDDDFELVSQEDIDKLLGGVSLNVDEPAPEDDGGEFSQDDIDSLLNGISRDTGAPDERVQLETGEDELISQDDIDSLLDGISKGPDEASGDASPPPAGDDDALVSQDDIDRILGSVQAGSVDDSDDDEAMEPISLGDISRVIQDTDTGAQQPGDALGDSGSPADPAGIGIPPVSATKPVIPSVPAREEIIISESQGMDIQDCLITQETIDSLIREDENSGIEVELEPEPEPAQQVNLEDAIDTDGWEDEGKDISQEDIDSLLNTPDDDLAEDTEEYESLISQDDIEELLKVSAEEDVDLLEDDFDIVGDDHQVVLEDADTLPEEDASGQDVVDTESLKKKWYRSRLVLAGITLVILLGAGIPSGYYFLFREEPAPDVQQQAAITETSPPAAFDSVAINLEPRIPDRAPGTMAMDKFMILVPSRKDGLNYVSADISIDYSDGKALNLISRNLPRYRDIVFDAIGTSLSSEKGEKITEKELLVIIREALNKALPEPFIDKVAFTAFKTG